MRAAEQRARLAYSRALERGDATAQEEAAKRLDEARERLRAMAARIQREAKRSADLLYPRAATLEETQERLEEGQALVVYGLCDTETLALVVTPDAARLVRLGVDYAQGHAVGKPEPMVDVIARLANMQKASAG